MERYTFELTDGKTTRTAYFKRVSMQDGINILTSAEGVTNSDKQAINDFLDYAIKYLVIKADKYEQDIKNIDELDTIFENPFLPLKIAEEFENYIAPYLERLGISQNNMEELKAQAVKKRR